jgi:hypothetical protein
MCYFLSADLGSPLVIEILLAIQPFVISYFNFSDSCQVIEDNILFFIFVHQVNLMIEAVGSSKTSVNIYQPKLRNIPEDNHLHTRRRENVKYHLSKSSCYFLTLWPERVGYFPRNPFSDIISLFACTSLSTRDQVSHPYKVTCRPTYIFVHFMLGF